MDWTQFSTFMIANMVFTLTLWLWSRSESRADIKEVRAVQAEDRKELLTILREIKEEQKDFHGRLCSIEERRGR